MNTSHLKIKGNINNFETAETVIYVLYQYLSCDVNMESKA